MRGEEHTNNPDQLRQVVTLHREFPDEEKPRKYINEVSEEGNLIQEPK